MDGMELNGRKIVVRTHCPFSPCGSYICVQVRRDVYDLPEFTGRMQDFIDQQTPQPPPSPLKRGWDNLKYISYKNARLFELTVAQDDDRRSHAIHTSRLETARVTFRV